RSIDHQVRGDPVEPGVNGRLAPEGRQRLVGADKNLLRQILGIRTVVREATDVRIDAVLVLADQRVKSCRGCNRTLVEGHVPWSGRRRDTPPLHLMTRRRSRRAGGSIAKRKAQSAKRKAQSAKRM